MPALLWVHWAGMWQESLDQGNFTLFNFFPRLLSFLLPLCHSESETESDTCSPLRCGAPARGASPPPAEEPRGETRSDTAHKLPSNASRSQKDQIIAARGGAARRVCAAFVPGSVMKLLICPPPTPPRPQFTPATVGLTHRQALART